MAVFFHDDGEISLEDLKKKIGLDDREPLDMLPMADFVRSRHTHKRTQKEIEQNTPYYNHDVYRCAKCKRTMELPEFITVSRFYSVYQCPECKTYQEIL